MSKQSDEWATPWKLFCQLSDYYGKFTLDPCCTDENTKVKDSYLTIHEDGLKHSWEGHRVFCNPPYSDIYPWVQKAFMQKAETILLLPVRTSVKWFQQYYEKADILFLDKRVKFVGSKSNAPFDCMVWYVDRRS